MSVEDTDDREMASRNDIDPTYTTTTGWSGPGDQQNNTCHLHLALCNFIALLRGP